MDQSTPNPGDAQQGCNRWCKTPGCSGLACEASWAATALWALGVTALFMLMIAGAILLVEALR